MTNAECENTRIQAIASPEEHESVVAKLQEIVGNDTYQVVADDGSLRTPEYRKQLIVYYHVLRELYPEREIPASLFYTVDGVREEVDPLSQDDLVDVVQTVSSVKPD